ncbi:energy-coupling factor ABC transporter ATP-binding protein [Shimazuella kribbensis]|uniref:energy-coupling factor ABC transporter ATP-binding protein n=1 Tax=Shimazuella kribbensis TaxID=139808 RepID=UPI0004095795|nr:ABC transporter ATP-binding protein [Shimazuella kribbensis]
MSYIELKQVSYQYPLASEWALNDVTYSFEKGKLYGIIGANRGGKTTLCNLVRGFIPHFYQGELMGQVLIEGKDIREWENHQLSTEIGYIFQNPFSQISGVKETVFEEIALGLENLGVDKDEMIERTIQVVKWLKLEDLIKKNPNNLSGGQRQRVAFASIIVMNHDILVIDEPTSQLDPSSTAEVFEIIHMLKEQKKTILLVEHKVELIAEYADEVLVFEKGQIASYGSPADILSRKDLMERGISIPSVALLGHEMREKNMAMDSIPITKSQALEQILKGGKNDD